VSRDAFDRDELSRKDNSSGPTGTRTRSEYRAAFVCALKYSAAAPDPPHNAPNAIE
jgi:hypothetical protein